MNKWRLVGLIFVLTVTGFTISASGQAIWYVDDDAASDPGPGDAGISDPLEDGSSAHPYDAIQEAINRSSSGDEVLVRDGLYTGMGNRDINYGGRLITVRSQNGPASCVIDAQASSGDAHRGFLFASEEGQSAVLDGFTIRGGHTQGNFHVDWSYGGGIYCYRSSPTIRNCVITGNVTNRWGGGIALRDHANALIENCVISDNVAWQTGGGLACEDSGAAVVRNSKIIGNVNNGDLGGGIGLVSSSIDLEACEISGNRAQYGGGVGCGGSSPTIVNSKVVQNEATNSGGGIYCAGNSHAALTNVTFSDNLAVLGGGVFATANSSPEFANSILWWDSASSEGPEIGIAGDSSVKFTYSNVQGGPGGAYLQPGCALCGVIWGNFNIDEDPTGGASIAAIGTWGENGYRLSSNSPCLDLGKDDVDVAPNTSGFQPIPPNDQAGLGRFADGDGDGIVHVDIGALEYQGFAPLAAIDELAKNRFVTFILPQGNGDTALRVELTSLHHPAGPANAPNFGAFEGQYRYVNAIKDGQGNDVFDCLDSAVWGNTYKCAVLGCQPEYRDWAAIADGQLLHVTGSAVVPSSTYRIAQVPSTCMGQEPTCAQASNPLVVTTERWGNVDANPPGGAPAALDIGRVVDKVKDIPGAFPEPRCQLRDATPAPYSAAVIAQDIARCIDAVKGQPYPFSIAVCP